MANVSDSRDKTLFRKHGDWPALEQRYRQQLAGEVQKLGVDAFLDEGAEASVARAVERCTLHLPVLDEENTAVSHREVEVSRMTEHLALEAGFQRPQKLVRPSVMGTEYEFHIPFTGDDDLFHIIPPRRSQSPPQAKVLLKHLFHTVTGSNLSQDQVQSAIRHFIDEVNKHLGWLGEVVHPWNAALPGRARAMVDERRAKLLNERAIIVGLGFKLLGRPGASQVFAAPEVRRKVAPVVPRAGGAPSKPEPAMDAESYEHILRVVSMGAVMMERSPDAFRTMDEEAIRTVLLVLLNSHFEGQATGETFNRSGKTDILVRSQDRNIFIGECKLWGRARVLTDTIDQVLGYAVWRDTKVAVVVFNRNRDFTRVLDQVQPTVQAHPNCKAFVSRPSETQFRFVFRHRDDPNREMTLTVLLFDVPTP